MARLLDRCGFNPYISLPYLVFTGMTGLAVFLLLRSLWNKHNGSWSWPTTWKW